MGKATLIPVAEYLSTSYRPDRDFLEGELEERNMGERPHAKLQGFFAYLFRLNQTNWKVVVLTEQRVRISATRYRVPDICVVWNSDPDDAIVETAPLLCIEILSKDDTLKGLQNRVDDYAAIGIEHVWAIDPWQRRAYYCSPSGFVQPADNTLRIEGTPIEVSLTEAFAELDPQP
jgi:Uma2 family endonuclease